MLDITITFQQEGYPAIAFKIPAAIATKLDQFIAEVGATDAEGKFVPTYASKGDLFLKHNVTTLLKPIVERYPDLTPELQAKKEQIAQLEAEIVSALSGDIIVPVEG